jgi:hypothetical protein
MIFSKKKEAYNNTQSINIHIHNKCIIFNETFDYKNNKLYDFKDYNLLLIDCKQYVSKDTVKKIEEFLINNCVEIQNIIKENKPGIQTSLF